MVQQLYESKLGYLLFGPVGSTTNVRNSAFRANTRNVITSLREEDHSVERFWNLETLGITEPDPCSDEHNFIREYQQTSISRETDGSYTARFPWEKDHLPLPTNSVVCEKRTRVTIKRLSQTPDLIYTHGTIIKEQEKRGFIEKISNTTPNHNLHYLPYHPVKKDSPNTPIRIVYDCSCKTSPKQASLNECLQPGPPLLNDMSAILLRFRTHNYGIVTDIEKVFLHLNLHKNDRDFNSDLATQESTADTNVKINVLSMHWNTSSENLTLTHKSTVNTCLQLITKRKVLQQSSKIFDHEISFVMAKTRVAPIKKLTLPQLELMAALVGSRLLSFIHNAIKSQYDTKEVHLWSDGQIVLHWIDKQLKQIIANRVNSIKELFPPSTWRYNNKFLQ